MTSEEYEVIVADLMAEAAKIEQSKRPEYTMQSEDVLNNFRSIAKRLGVRPEMVWSVYFLKHVDAITAHCQEESPEPSEAVKGRFADAINYLRLGWALLSDSKGKCRVYFGPEFFEPPPTFS